ncbi:MAG TPA: class I SAM-dependent methyltransferase [Polyangiaceae bacterium]|nr:class I SAM-dependent methyltransferase [Polyangiaceae bacterium]
MFQTDKLSPADAAILETFVVPRYLSLFGELAQQMLLVGESARIIHLGCRTGYPDLKIYEHGDGPEMVGVDSSLPALELARNKAHVMGGVHIEYRPASDGALDDEEGLFTHALTLHPAVGSDQRLSLLSEMERLLCSGGQAVIALPLRGSFQEIADLFREYALKHDDSEFSKAVEAALMARPSIESLSEELEQAGLSDVDVEIRQTSLTFDSGRAFVEDPVSRLLILPEVKAWIGVEDVLRPLAYVRDAIDKYWSEGKLELSLNVGCASARKP